MHPHIESVYVPFAMEYSFPGGRFPKTLYRHPNIRRLETS